MGVDYSAASGYGFEFPYYEAEGIAERLGYAEGEWDFDPDSFALWLVEGTDLGYNTCGNFMSGDDMYIIIEAKRVGKSLDHYGWGGSFQKFSEMRVSDQQEAELQELFEKVHGRPAVDGEISWYMSTTVS